MPISASNKGLMIPHTVSFERLVFIFHKKMPVLRDELTKVIFPKYYKHLPNALAHRLSQPIWAQKVLMIPHTVSFECLVFIFSKTMPVLRDELTKLIYAKYHKHLPYALASIFPAKQHQVVDLDLW